jgi:hypothetical protein
VGEGASPLWCTVYSLYHNSAELAFSKRVSGWVRDKRGKGGQGGGNRKKGTKSIGLKPVYPHARTMVRREK